MLQGLTSPLLSRRGGGTALDVSVVSENRHWACMAKCLCLPWPLENGVLGALASHGACTTSLLGMQHYVVMHAFMLPFVGMTSAGLERSIDPLAAIHGHE